MNTRLVMWACVIVLGLAGGVLSFVPEEILAIFSLPESNLNQLFLQLLGGAYIAFAMMNWASREAVLGGIYGKPVVLANFGHFLIGSLTLIKAVLIPEMSFLWPAGGLYLLFFAAFAYLLFNHPKAANQTE